MNAFALKIRRLKLSDKILAGIVAAIFTSTVLGLIYLRMFWVDEFYWLLN